MLVMFIRELYDIWNYRAMLSNEAKKNIIGDEIIFNIPVQIIKYEKNYPNFLLNVGRFICRGSKEKKEFKSCY